MPVPKTIRKDFVKDEHLEYLDELRESATTNMYGASPLLTREFGLERDEARHVLQYWMATFGQEER